MKKRECFAEFIGLWLTDDLPPAGRNPYQDRAERWDRARLEASKRTDRQVAWMAAGRRAARATRDGGGGSTTLTTNAQETARLRQR